jgi:probable blue pigment (indigoidine) exporter|tara:strand:- start:1881 stop:2843 length:963 start_codon:yes stop_codon:yes gene_type:complete
MKGKIDVNRLYSGFWVKVVAVYISVVLLWSTTPLAIKWSNESFSFIAAVSLRMFIACALALLLLALLQRPLFSIKGAWKVYAVASLGLFPAMPLVYWAAQYISSGMLALIFSMTPIATGVVSIFILRENPFTVVKSLALLLAITGLVVIFGDQVVLGSNAGLGVVAALGACSIMGGSSVLLKSLAQQSQQIGSLQQTTGALLFAVPALFLTWGLAWYFGGDPWPQQVSDKSLWAIAYLTLFGSLLGFTFYYYLLRNISPISLSLVTLITPVLALYLGHWLDSELISARLLCGAAMIVVALGIYQGLSPLKLLRLFKGAAR